MPPPRPLRVKKHFRQELYILFVYNVFQKRLPLYLTFQVHNVFQKRLPLTPTFRVYAVFQKRLPLYLYLFRFTMCSSS